MYKCIYIYKYIYIQIYIYIWLCQYVYTSCHCSTLSWQFRVPLRAAGGRFAPTVRWPAIVSDGQPRPLKKKTMGIISPTMWGPPVINCFISPINYSFVSTINHTYWNYVHQFNYCLGAPHCTIAYYGFLRDVYQWWDCSGYTWLYWDYCHTTSWKLWR